MKLILEKLNEKKVDYSEKVKKNEALVDEVESQP